MDSGHCCWCCFVGRDASGGGRLRRSSSYGRKGGRHPAAANREEKWEEGLVLEEEAASRGRWRGRRGRRGVITKGRRRGVITKKKQKKLSRVEKPNQRMSLLVECTSYLVYSVRKSWSFGVSVLGLGFEGGGRRWAAAITNACTRRRPVVLVARRRACTPSCASWFLVTH